jgi:non-specific serine/threonine protein kinase/serine/threonine-protein kinase
MATDRYVIANQIFLEVRDLPPPERVAALAELCGADATLRAEVESLLASDDREDAGAPAALPARGANADPPTTASPPPRRSSPQRMETLADDLALAARAGDIRVGPYRVLHELGRGGMGIVYLAVREGDRIQRRVAVKVLKRGMDTDDVLRRFEIERTVLAALNHPGVARLYDCGETDDGLPYFVMEYIEGLPIDKYCDVNRLDIDRRLALFRNVCLAVHCAHQNLIVHRDIKPSNIIVTAEGQPKLLDFGIAKLINPGLAMIAPGATAPELRVMTPEYASPEQVRGQPVGTASDVYSLGVLLYELVTGHAPYRLRSRVRAEIERVVCEEDPEAPSTAVSKIEQTDSDQDGAAPITPEAVSRTREGRPERLRRRLAGDIDNIVLMAMRKEQSRRYTSAEQFAEDIQRHLDGMPVIARPDTFAYRASKFARRHRYAVAAAAVCAISVTGGLAVAAAGWHDASDARDGERLLKQAAQRERDLAARRFDQVRALARTFMFDFHDAIQELDGSIPARELLVRTALAYLDPLAAEAEGNRALQLELASAYDRVGDIVGGIRNPSTGDFGDAIEHYRKALAIRRAVADADPGSAAAQDALAGSQENLGDHLLRSGDVTGALAAHRAALEIREGLAARGGDTFEARRGVAVALSNVGDALARAGDGPGATAHYQRSLELREALALLQPDDEDAQRDLSVMCIRVGARHHQTGDHEAARALYERAIGIRTRLLEADPDSGRHRRDLAVARYHLGGALFSLEDFEGARGNYAEYVAVMEQRRRDNPDDARSIFDLATGHDLLGQTLAKAGAWDEAEEHFRQFEALADELAATAPERVQYAQQRALARVRRADVHLARGDAAAATQQLEDALAIVEPLARADEKDARLRRDQAMILAKLGDCAVARKQALQAGLRYEAARQIYESLVAGDARSAQLRHRLADVVDALARLADSVGDATAATGHRARAAELRTAGE